MILGPLTKGQSPPGPLRLAAVFWWVVQNKDLKLRHQKLFDELFFQRIGHGGYNTGHKCMRLSFDWNLSLLILGAMTLTVWIIIRVSFAIVE